MNSRPKIQPNIEIIILVIHMDENYIYYVFGKNLKKYRKLKGLTQEQLAERSLYAISFIKNIESEKVFQTFSVGTAYKFAQVLEIPLGKLFEEPEASEETEENN